MLFKATRGVRAFVGARTDISTNLRASQSRAQPKNSLSFAKNEVTRNSRTLATLHPTSKQITNSNLFTPRMRNFTWSSSSTTHQNTLPISMTIQSRFMAIRKEHDPDLELLTRKTPSKGKAELLKNIRNLWPEGGVQMNYVHPELRYKESGARMKFDIYVPSLNIAFEYQGAEHFLWHHHFGDPAPLQKRDAEKKEACAKKGLTLICVPFWWDNQSGPLTSTIYQVRPELIKYKNLTNITEGDSPPIPTELPERYKKYTVKPDFLVEKEIPYPYRITYGLRGGVAKCRGCKEPIPNDKPRILTYGTHTPTRSENPQPAKYYFCAKMPCINKAMEHRGTNSGVDYPPWDGKVAIPSEIKDKVSRDLPEKIEGMEFIVC